jgi:hypothetical protein
MSIKSIGNSVASFRNRFGATGVRAYRDITQVPFSATSSGTIATPASGLAPGNGYIYHTFTGPGTFTVSGTSGIVEYIVVAGGGGGGSYYAGGGGAGGLRTNVSGHPLSTGSPLPISPGSYTVTVGAGGTGGASNTLGTTGNSSYFGPPSTPQGITADGGGGGGSNTPNSTGKDGGSGGGGGTFLTTQFPGGTGNRPNITTPAQGNPGGSGSTDNASYRNGGGGGGAGSVGGSAGPNAGGPGGPGSQFPSFTGPLIGTPSLSPLSGYFAGGGGGGVVDVFGHTQGSGGLGGGGNGGPPSTFNGAPGTTNSGGGGGGGSHPGNGIGGTGGPGIVIIRYLAT